MYWETELLPWVSSITRRVWRWLAHTVGFEQGPFTTTARAERGMGWRVGLSLKQ